MALCSYSVKQEHIVAGELTANLATIGTKLLDDWKPGIFTSPLLAAYPTIS